MTKMLRLGMLLGALAVMATASPGKVEVISKEIEDVLRSSAEGDEATVFALAFTKNTAKCKELGPVYRKAAKAMKAVTNVRFIKVDAAENADLASLYEVESGPTIVIVKKIPGHKDVPYTFGGKMTESEIVAELTTVAAPEWRPPVNAVTALSSDDFDEFVEAQKASPILFYTKKSYCTKCKRARQEFIIASSILAAEFPSVGMGSVNCEEERDICMSVGIKGKKLPVLNIFHGSALAFDTWTGSLKGSNLGPALVEYFSPVAKPLTSAADVQAAIDTFNISVIAYVHDTAQKHEVLEMFETGARPHRDAYAFFTVTDPKLIEEFSEGAEENFIIAYQDSRFRSPLTLNTTSTTLGAAEDLSSLVEQAADSMKPPVLLKTRKDPQVGLALGLHTNTNPNNIDQDGGFPYNDDTLPRVEVYFKVDYSTPEAADQTRARWLEVVAASKQFGPHGLHFAFASDEEYNSLLEFEWGMGEVLKDDIKVIAFSGGGRIGEKYVMKSDMVLEEFCGLFMYKNVLVPHKRGAAVPDEPLDGNVHIVVTSTFSKIVEDWKNDVLLLMYDRRDASTSKLMSIWRQLATQMKDVKNLVVARIDMSVNDVPHGSEEFRTEGGLPTIYLAPRGEDLPAALHIEVKDRPMHSLKASDFLQLLAPGEEGIKKPEITKNSTKEGKETDKTADAVDDGGDDDDDDVESYGEVEEEATEKHTEL